MNGKIYLIRNIKNNKIYIGKTSSIGRRISMHKSMAKKLRKNYLNFHYFMHEVGIENFETFIIEENIDSKEKLNDREKYYINLCDSTNPEIGYNIRPCNTNNQNIEESRKNINEILSKSFKFIRDSNSNSNSFKKENKKEKLLDYLENNLSNDKVLLLKDVLLSNRISRATFYNYIKDTQFRSDNGKICRDNTNKSSSSSIEEKVNMILSIVSNDKLPNFSIEEKLDLILEKLTKEK